MGHANERRSKSEKTLRRMRKRLTPSNPPEVAVVEAEREQASLDRELHLRLARHYRTVGDAIAWRLHNFQTRIIDAFGMNQGPGIIGQKAGADAEAEQAERYWREHGAFALRHDFTNCLRIWDLTVCYPEPTRGADIIEVKSASGRVRSGQRNQIKRLSEFIDHNVMTSSDGVLVIHRLQLPNLPDGPEQTNFPLIVNAIVDSEDGGYATHSSPYFSVKALNLLNPVVQHPDESTCQRLASYGEIPQEFLATPRGDFLVADSVFKVRTPSFGAPFTVYPLWPNAAAALVTGYLRLAFHLNICAVVEAFQKAGFEAQYIPPGGGSSRLVLSPQMAMSSSCIAET